MATTLRDLLIQRAARLQDRPALTASGWGTLSYAQLRNRAEGVALGLLAGPPPPRACSTTGTPWDWVAELAVAASGLVWDAAGKQLPPDILGGPQFNAEEGRGAYHDREQAVSGGTPFSGGLTHGDMMGRLRRLNLALGWDHDTQVDLPLARLPDPALRAALWSVLYAGGHARLEIARAPMPGWLPWSRRDPAWMPGPFQDFWS